MRIISGNLKGKSISFIKSLTTRPLKDSVKENIFNILAHSRLIKVNLHKSKVLDLYSGVGSFGLECISRGANKIFFVEKDSDTAKILNKNIVTLGVESKAKVEIEEIKKFLDKKNNEKFDIFFLDPPFLNNNLVEDLLLIKQKRIYKTNHLIIIHREKNSTDSLKKIIDPLIVKNYGRSKIIFGRFLS